MTALIALLALSAPASADDLSVEGYLQATPDGGSATGFGARLDGGGRAFLAAEGRVGAGGADPDLCLDPADDRWWIGRATGGVDLFGNSDGLDLTLGMFLGSAGGWSPEESRADLTAGFEFGLGLKIGHLSGRYRHANGFAGPLESHLSENEWRLSYGMFDERLQVFGQYVRFNPGDAIPRGGYGMGAGFTF